MVMSADENPTVLVVSLYPDMDEDHPVRSSVCCPKSLSETDPENPLVPIPE